MANTIPPLKINTDPTGSPFADNPIIPVDKQKFVQEQAQFVDTVDKPIVAEVNENIYDKMSFSEAFGAARKIALKGGANTFTWNNVTYGTQLGSDTVNTSKPLPKTTVDEVKQEVDISLAEKPSVLKPTYKNIPGSSVQGKPNTIPKTIWDNQYMAQYKPVYDKMSVNEKAAIYKLGVDYFKNPKKETLDKITSAFSPYVTTKPIVKPTIDTIQKPIKQVNDIVVKTEGTSAAVRTNLNNEPKPISKPTTITKTVSPFEEAHAEANIIDQVIKSHNTSQFENAKAGATIIENTNVKPGSVNIDTMPFKNANAGADTINKTPLKSNKKEIIIPIEKQYPDIIETIRKTNSVNKGSTGITDLLTDTVKVAKRIEGTIAENISHYLKNVPEDVKTEWKGHASKGSAKYEYGILSKTDKKMYFFDKNNVPVGVFQTMIGYDENDEPSTNYNFSTPAGRYGISKKYTEIIGAQKYHYPTGFIALNPKNKDSVPDEVIGMHDLYLPEKEKREELIRNGIFTGSQGCINFATPEGFAFAKKLITPEMDSIYITKQPELIL